MKVVFHLGAHSTDEDRIVRVLAGNRDVLETYRIAVPAPRRYRMVLRDALVSLKGGPAPQDIQDALLEACTDRPDIERLVFSHEFFLCIPERVVTQKGFYVMAPGKLGPLANLFPSSETEFHLALINPATLLPQLVRRLPKRSYEQIMQGHDPRDLRWEPVIRDMAAAAGGRRLVIWCNEDLPLIWPEVLRAVGGLPESQALDGELMILEQIMPPDGVARLRSYLQSHPPKSILQRRKIFTVFLDKYARSEAIEIEAPLPGWTDELVAEITAQYDADVAAIARMPGVEFIAP
ncbi:MAG: hypothetical protein H5U24_18535 [Thioclava marina]|jgi:hypothetical protein|uniref:hypothetical protein n=1 Tax=Thioclava marina TaxID=1915077 RepID=UPI0019ABA5B2|nr:MULTISPECIES: hypothetical protein [Thioclava]MBC7147372.1 hypothetical protein [Thioclava marina]MBD3804807.1 hypothetical protein [Thioclava sp.]TNF12102.1 MAG: hypothetical protein EP320_12890 [Paracoccaceae bacterium]